MKFVPNIFKNNFEIFDFLLSEIDNLTLSLNKTIFFEKANINNNVGRNLNCNKNNSRVTFNVNSEKEEENDVIEEFIKEYPTFVSDTDFEDMFD